MNLRYKAGQRAETVIPISLLLALLLGLFFAGQALAGGLYLEEFGTPSMGVASAGAEAVAVDASASWRNPAGMTRIQGSELMLTGGLG